MISNTYRSLIYKLSPRTARVTRRYAGVCVGEVGMGDIPGLEIWLVSECLLFS